MSVNPRMARVVRRVRMDQAGNDAAYWRSRPPEERLRAQEEIRREFHDQPAAESPNDDSSRIQRVCRVLEQA
jgi:hypothetical protein